MSDFFYFTVCKSAFLQFTLDRWRMAFQQLSSQCLLRPGKVLNHLSHSTASRGLLGSKEHAGFLYVRPTFQSLDGIPLPSQPFLFGLLILRAETPWARAFPLRLMLRLGAEYRCKCWRCCLTAGDWCLHNTKSHGLDSHRVLARLASLLNIVFCYGTMSLYSPKALFSQWDYLLTNNRTEIESRISTPKV